MIISASRRTDIPAFHTNWFMECIDKGYVETVNPYNKKVSKISLLPEEVDCIVFWTKNPLPLIKHLDRLQDYKYYFQFTLNSYGTDIEPYVPNKNDVIIPVFKELSKRIGKEKVIWRYDPLFITDKYTIDYHYYYFDVLCNELKDYTEVCVFSFLDIYDKLKERLKNVRQVENIEETVKTLGDIGKHYGIRLQTCSEDLIQYHDNVFRGSCIDINTINRITGKNIKYKKDKGQRSECLCHISKDIGQYNTCKHMCKYCYANIS